MKWNIKTKSHAQYASHSLHHHAKCKSLNVTAMRFCQGNEIDIFLNRRKIIEWMPWIWMKWKWLCVSVVSQSTATLTAEYSWANNLKTFMSFHVVFSMLFSQLISKSSMNFDTQIGTHHRRILPFVFFTKILPKESIVHSNINEVECNDSEEEKYTTKSSI